MLSTWEAIFPTPVLRTNIGRDFTAEELAFVAQARAHTCGNVLNTRTIDTHVLNAGELPSIRSYIDEYLTQFVKKTISTSKRIEVYISQSWINFTGPGQAHHRHFHTNSLISGAFYISVVKAIDGIRFYKNVTPMISAVNKEEQNWYNADCWFFSVAPGDLLLFPSTLTHGVDENKASHTRVSLSFNTFIRGDLGSEDLLNHLTL